MMRTASWIADYPDGDNFMQLLYGKNIHQSNNACAAIPEYDKLYEETRYLENAPARVAKFKRMNEIIREEVPMMLTWNPMAFGIYQKWVGNLKRNMMMDLPLKYYNVDPELKSKGIASH